MGFAGADPDAANTARIIILQRMFLDWTGALLFTAMAWIFIPAYCFAIP